MKKRKKGMLQMTNPTLVVGEVRAKLIGSTPGKSGVGVRKLAEAAAEDTKATAEPHADLPNVSVNEVRILLYLRDMHPQSKFQYDIVEGARLARATVSTCLANLRAVGLVHRPHGNRKGDGLTNRGKTLADRLAANPPR